MQCAMEGVLLLLHRQLKLSTHAAHFLGHIVCSRKFCFSLGPREVRGLRRSRCKHNERDRNHNQQQGNDDADADGFGLNVEGRYFFQDNLRAQANVGWASIDFGGGDDDALTFGAGGEYQFDALPVSIALNYAHSEFDEADVDSDTISLGVRWNWGGTLRDRDLRIRPETTRRTSRRRALAKTVSRAVRRGEGTTVTHMRPGRPTSPDSVSTIEEDDLA